MGEGTADDAPLNRIALAARRAVARLPEVEAYALFGSRARGHATDASDWDVVEVTREATGSETALGHRFFAHLDNVDVSSLRREVLIAEGRRVDSMATQVLADARPLAGDWSLPRPKGTGYRTPWRTVRRIIEWDVVRRLFGLGTERSRAASRTREDEAIFAADLERGWLHIVCYVAGVLPHGHVRLPPLRTQIGRIEAWRPALAPLARAVTSLHEAADRREFGERWDEAERELLAAARVRGRLGARFVAEYEEFRRYQARRAARRSADEREKG